MVVTSIITTLVGQELLSETGKSIYNGITGVLTHDNPIITRILDELDVIASLKIIQSLITDIKSYHYETKTFQIALEFINDITKKINDEVDKINIEEREHNDKWFASWRTPIYLKRIKHLKLLKQNMDKRFDYIVKIIKINNDLMEIENNNK